MIPTCWLQELRTRQHGGSATRRHGRARAEGSAIDMGHRMKYQIFCLTASSTGRGRKGLVSPERPGHPRVEHGHDPGRC